MGKNDDIDRHEHHQFLEPEDERSRERPTPNVCSSTFPLVTESKNFLFHRDDKNSEPEKYVFPKYVFLILGNEFCERYAFYGLRATLTLYCTYFLAFSESSATVIYHGFIVAAYISPIIGAVLADGFYGKFKIILWLSLVYALGIVVQAISAIPSIGNYEEGEFRTTNAFLSLLGLSVIAFGTGGIKPCVSSFGADQFESGDTKNKDRFFNMFYWCINAGSVISTFVSPVLRRTTCGGFGTDTSCYFLSFLIPAILMVLAIVFFLMGAKLYKKIPPSNNNILWQCIRCVWYGIWNRGNIPEESPRHDHWLYGAYGKVETWIIRDTTYILKVLVMFIPIPMFWAAFDQKGSRWTLMAVNLNGYLHFSDTKFVYILPDQVQLLNAAFILMLIPVFDWLYNKIDRGFGEGTCSKLRRLSLGLFLAAFTYFVAGRLQAKIDENLTNLPKEMDQMSLSVLNLQNSPLVGKFRDFQNIDNSAEIFNENMEIESGHKSMTAETILTNFKHNSTLYGFNEEKFDNDLVGGRLNWHLAYLPNNNVKTYQSYATKSIDGLAQLIIVSGYQQQITVSLKCSDADNIYCSQSDGFDQVVNPCGEESRDCILGTPEMKDKFTLTRGKYYLAITDKSGKNTNEDINLDTGASYTLAIYGDTEPKFNLVKDINPNDVSVAYIVPQYFMITCSEILISVTGLNFAYQEAPIMLKSVVTSMWLCTNSIGNVFVILIAKVKVSSQELEFYVFGLYILAAAILFSGLAIWYYEYTPKGEFDNFEYPEEIARLMPGRRNRRKKIGDKDAIEEEHEYELNEMDKSK